MATERKQAALAAAIVLNLAFGAGTVRAEEAELISLKNSMSPFQEHFNSLEGRPRFVAVLSPT